MSAVMWLASERACRCRTLKEFWDYRLVLNPRVNSEGVKRDHGKRYLVCI